MFLFLQTFSSDGFCGFQQWLTPGDAQSFQARWQVLVQRFQRMTSPSNTSSSRDTNWSQVIPWWRLDNWLDAMIFNAIVDDIT